MSTTESTMSILVYSDDRTTREKVRLALGRRPAADVPKVSIHEVATAASAVKAVTAGGIDVLVLDGEATPTGGMGLARQLKEEIYQSPPVLILLGRPQDAWLATWSRADAAVPHPLDALAVATSVAELMRARLRGLPAVS